MIYLSRGFSENTSAEISVIENNFQEIIFRIIEDKGKDIIFDTVKLKSLLLDYTKNEYKKETNLFITILNAECAKIINMTDDPDLCKIFLAKRLEEEHSLSPIKSSQMLDLLFVILLGKNINSKKVQQSQRIIMPFNDQLELGTVIIFGNYYWRILDIQNDKILILSENIIEIRQYNIVSENVTWDNCTLRKYLNNEFFNNFSAEQQKNIINTRNYNNNNYWYNTNGGIKTNDKIFLLDLDESDKYFGNSTDYVSKKRKIQDIGKIIPDINGYYFTNNHDSQRVTEFKHKSCWWWLRSPGGNCKSAACVYDDGGVNVSGFIVNNLHGGVRPALWLNL